MTKIEKQRAGEGMVHCYPLLAPYFEEATTAMDEICEFVKKTFGNGIKYNKIRISNSRLLGLEIFGNVLISD
jgi:hypothetical protein